MSKTHKVTKDKAIKCWLLREQGNSYSEVGRRMKITGDTAKAWAAKVDADKDWLREAKARLADKPKANSTKKPKQRGELAGKVRSWLDENPAGTLSQFLEQTKVEVSSPFFSHLKRDHKEKKQQQPNGKEQVAEAKRGIGIVTRLRKAESENAFLKWWVTGERKGWVDRLLKESQQ